MWESKQELAVVSCSLPPNDDWVTGINRNDSLQHINMSPSLLAVSPPTYAHREEGVKRKKSRYHPPMAAELECVSCGEGEESASWKAGEDGEEGKAPAEEAPRPAGG